MAVALRPLGRRDKAAVMRMLRSIPEFKPAEVVVAQEVIDCYLAEPGKSGYYALVAEQENEVCGYVCYGPTPLTEGTWDIYWMAVSPPRQGRGIGGGLIAAAEKAIAGAGGRLAVIETSSLPSYDKTRRFYASHGYAEVARVPDFYAPGDDKMMLTKRLAGL
jgi:ribosomal protein S18 acetylase RimI-like enzyme